MPDYGYVWTPTVVVGARWSPFRDGRWIWMGGDYVWVAYEPWGWAPYHYGRWSFIINIGWFWVPPIAREVYWSPGYVGWVRTADYVAWVPLAPGEIYYGRGYYGQHSVNITNVNINQVSITNVYKNVYVNNGVTVVNRNTFNTHSPTVVNVNKNIIEQKIFAKNNISVGAPDIKPTKASYFVSDKQVTHAKLPPQHVRDLQIKQLKQSRPHIKAPDKSVLNPGAEPNALPLKTVSTQRTPGKGKPMIQQVHPKDEGKPGVPEAGPAPRNERQIKPSEKKPVVPEAGPAPRDERQIKPSEKKAVPEVSPAPRGERQIKPSEKKAVVPEVSPAPRGERQQVKPAERVKPSGSVVSPTDRGERQQVKPAERVKPSGSVVSPTDRGEKQQVQPEEKRKPVVPECGPGQKDEMNPDKCPQCGPGQKDEMNPDKCPQKGQKKHGAEKP